MSRKKKGQPAPLRWIDRQSRLSLTLLFAGAAFLILLTVLIVVGGFALIMVNVGAFRVEASDLATANHLTLMMLLIAFAIGAAFAFLFGRIFMKPINLIINMMNRLAAGDFRARIRFDGIFARHPAVRELTGSINTMASELEKTEMLRSDFINNFSHEFKTPIVSIAGFAKLLREGGLTAQQQQEYLTIIEEESLRLSDMATNVLSLTHIENQTILSDLSVYNLAEQLRSCFLVLEDKWTQKRLDLALDFDEVQIEANEELLRQVWINLIDNAVKFTPFGGSIGVRIREEDADVVVTVRNTGSSIAPENRERVFQKFFQEDRSHATQGNGVGLAVVRRVVQLHGGTVSAASEEDVTTFTVRLPRRQSAG